MSNEESTESVVVSTDGDGNEYINGRPVGHSTGNPACPALYGGFCHIPSHNTDEDED